MARSARNPYVGAAFRALALVLIFALSSLSAASAANYSDAAGGVWLKDIQRVRIGAQEAVWIWLGRPAGRNEALLIDVEIYQKPPASRFVLIYGPWAGAERMEEFAGALDKALEPTGNRLEKTNLSALARDDERRVLILPSGAWPQSLMQNWEEQVSSTDTIIYLGVRQNQVLKTNGSGAMDGVRPELMADGSSVDSLLGGERMQTDGPDVWRVGRTLNEFENLDMLAGGLIEYSLTKAGSERPVHSQISFGPNRRTAVAQDGGSVNAEKYARLILRNSTGAMLRVWGVPVPPSEGEIDGPAQVQIGKTAAFQVRLAPEYPQSERIGYRAAIYAPNQSRMHVQLLDERTFGKGEAWLGSFTYGEWQNGGDWRVSIEDQFGRTYAAALVNVVEYSLNALEPLAGAQRIMVLRDGRQMGNEEVRIRQADGEEWKSVRLRGGVLEFGVAGGQVAEVEVEVEGVVLRAKLEGNASDAWSGPLRWGVPALVLAAIFLIALRPKGRAIYRIHLPEPQIRENKKVVLCPQKLLEIIGNGVENGQGRQMKNEWVLRSDEAAELLHNCRAGGQALIASVEDVEEALGELARRGMVGRWQEWYGPIRKGEDEKTIRRRALMRQLHDRILETGVKPKEIGKKNGATLRGYSDSRKGEWLLFEQEKWRMHLRGKKPPSVLVFAKKEEKEEFEKEIAFAQGVWADRLRLAIQTRRMALATIKEIGQN